MTRTLNEALAYAGAQHQHVVMPPSLRAQGFDDWEGACQGFVRSCWDIGPLFGSAWAQWNGADPEDRHVGGSPDDAPVGAALCFKGSGPFGHIDFAAYPFPSGRSGAWSNDLLRVGGIDKVHRDAPVGTWHQGYLGYLKAVNDVDLPLAKPRQPAKPKSGKRYLAIDKSIGHLETALATARHQHDAADVKALEAEIQRLTRLYNTLRRK